MHVYISMEVICSINSLCCMKELLAGYVVSHPVEKNDIQKNYSHLTMKERMMAESSEA